MRVLVACEFSGTVRDALRRVGVEAISCDLLPTDVPGPHYQTDVRKLLECGWDAMIAFPPCTHLSSSGARWFKFKEEEQAAAIDFFMTLANAPIGKICIENPIGIMSTVWRKPNQIIQPWMFGHPESKATCLWLKGLPLLEPTEILPRPKSGRWENQTPSGQNKLGPSQDRWKQRSKTYEGIAEAMANQWFAARRAVKDIPHKE